MPGTDGTPSPPRHASSSATEELSYYKSQYEQLEVELADFQASSRELEAELEKDIEASEKRERQLKEKVESLRYEVEEWKTKYKQAKTEANSVQSTLQKEITNLREANRALQMTLRDIEVANDDFERQARNTTSSLEDLESKYNVAIERGVLLEEEMRNGEQERESLRIETQRLRDELSDLRIEADIVQEKLRKAEGQTSRRRKPAPLDPGLAAPKTPDVSEHSPVTTASSPTMATPPAKSASSVTSDAITPPSPTASESSTSMRKPGPPIGLSRPRVSITDLNAGSRSIRGRHTRAPSIPFSNGRSTPSVTSRQSISRLNVSQSSGLPRSGSLYQIRGLIGKMQKLEERVHSARSRLPAPVDTPTRVSPRSGSAMGQSSIPSSVTVRKTSRKRTSGSSLSSSVHGDATPSHIPQSRPSISRPSSRTSFSSRSSISHTHTSVLPPPRPDSRQSLNGSRTPLGHYSTNPTTESRRPRSSLSNYTGTTAHSHNISMTHIDEDGDTSIGDITTPTFRRSTFNEDSRSRSSIPAPGLKKRPSGGISAIPTPRKISSGLNRRGSDMGPPERKKSLADLGETY